MAKVQQEDPQLTQLQSSPHFSLSLKAVPLVMTDSTIPCDVSTGIPHPLVPSSWRRTVFDSPLIVTPRHSSNPVPPDCPICVARDQHRCPKVDTVMSPVSAVESTVPYNHPFFHLYNSWCTVRQNLYRDCWTTSCLKRSHLPPHMYWQVHTLARQAGPQPHPPPSSPNKTPNPSPSSQVLARESLALDIQSTGPKILSPTLTSSLGGSDVVEPELLNFEQPRASLVCL